MNKLSNNYKLHLPNGELHHIKYELEANQCNSLEIFLQELENEDPKLRLLVSQGQLLENDGSEITPEFFPLMDNDTDLYLVLPDLEGMFKLVK